MIKTELATQGLPLTTEQLQREIPFIYAWTNDKGVHYEIIRMENKQERIQFINTGETESPARLEVVTYEGDRYSAPRPYTLEEATKFIQVAVHAYPHAPITRELCEFVKAQAAMLDNAASRAIWLLKVKDLQPPTTI